jgi:hypothetical protein
MSQRAKPDRPKSGPGDAGRLAAWRIGRLHGAGFTHREAMVLIQTGNTDLHAILELIDRGCPPWLAARITAPFDSELPRSVY